MKKAILLSLILSLLLFGCGGGGGSTPTADTGGGSGGIGDVGTGGGSNTANLGTFTFYVPDEVTSNSLIDLTGEVSNGVRVAVRKYETTYRDIITQVCSDAIPTLCDTTDPPTAADWRCTACTVAGPTCAVNPYYIPPQTSKEICPWTVPPLCDTAYPPTTGDCTACTVEGPTCVVNPFYSLIIDPEACFFVVTGDPRECINVNDGPDLTKPLKTLTYKGINDTLLNSSGGGPVTVNIPASIDTNDTYVFDAVRYVAGDLLWVDSTTLIAATPETHCSFIGQVDTNRIGQVCAFFPLPVTDGIDAIVAADLHLGRHYWQGQDTQGTPDTADDISELYVVPGSNPDLAAVPGSPVVLSLPTEIRSGLTYQVGNNRVMGDIFRDNWYVRTREATTAETASMNAWVFVSDSSDRGTAAGIGALTLTAPGTVDAADTWVYHFGHFFFGPDILERGETYNDWLFVTNQSDPLVPMGSVPVVLP